MGDCVGITQRDFVSLDQLVRGKILPHTKELITNVTETQSSGPIVTTISRVDEGIALKSYDCERVPPDKGVLARPYNFVLARSDSAYASLDRILSEAGLVAPLSVQD